MIKNASHVLSPQLAVKEIKDTILRNNFKNLSEYFLLENQLQGFKFFDLTFDRAELNKKIPHGLPYIPTDIFVVKISGTGTLQFNTGLFDAKNLDITIDTPGSVRFFCGRYWKSPQGTSEFLPTDVLQCRPTIKGGDIITNVTNVNITNIIAAPTTAITFTGTNNLTGATRGVTIPTPTDLGTVCRIRHKGTSLSQVYTLNTAGLEAIGTVASGSYKLFTYGETLDLEWNGISWDIINSFTSTGPIAFPSTAMGTMITATGGTLGVAAYGTVVYNLAHWWREGNRCRVEWNLKQTAGGSNGSYTGDWLFNLPSGIRFNTSYVTANTGTTFANASFTSVVGTLHIHEGNSTSDVLQAEVYSTSQAKAFGLSINSSGGASTTIWSAASTTFNQLLALKLSLDFAVPEWQP